MEPLSRILLEETDGFSSLLQQNPCLMRRQKKNSLKVSPQVQTTCIEKARDRSLFVPSSSLFKDTMEDVFYFFLV